MTRQEIETFLPFLANESLQGEERREVEAAVAADTGLQAELAALRAVRTTLQDEWSYSPGAMGLARLMREVEAEAPAAVRPRTGRPVLWQAAAAVLLAVALGQGALLMRPGGTQPDGFSLASGPADAALTIAIRPDATEEALRSLLLQAGVEITAGPSALGFYQLAPAEGVTLDQARAILEASDIIDSLTTPED